MPSLRQPGAVRDSYIKDAGGVELNYGQHTSVFLGFQSGGSGGNKRPIFWFNNDGSLVGQNVLSATLTLTCVTLAAAADECYWMALDGNATPINEGTGTAAGDISGVCWNRYGTINAWTTPGGDYGSAVGDLFNLPTAADGGGNTRVYDVSKTIGWCINANAPFAIIGSKVFDGLGAQAEYYSREGATPPVLDIYYIPIATHAAALFDLRSKM